LLAKTYQNGLLYIISVIYKRATRPNSHIENAPGPFG